MLTRLPWREQRAEPGDEYCAAWLRQSSSPGRSTLGRLEDPWGGVGLTSGLG
jgi:hypothetical protein